MAKEIIEPDLIPECKGILPSVEISIAYPQVFDRGTIVSQLIETLDSTYIGSQQHSGASGLVFIATGLSENQVRENILDMRIEGLSSDNFDDYLTLLSYDDHTIISVVLY